jgi:hypothetical protein
VGALSCGINFNLKDDTLQSGSHKTNNSTDSRSPPRKPEEKKGRDEIGLAGLKEHTKGCPRPAQYMHARLSERAQYVHTSLDSISSCYSNKI